MHQTFCIPLSLEQSSLLGLQVASPLQELFPLVKQILAPCSLQHGIAFTEHNTIYTEKTYDRIGRQEERAST